MMIEHIVLFKLRADVSDEKKQAMLRHLTGLREVIPEIIEVRAGKNFTSRAQGYTHAFVARFNSREALDAYLSHPAHTAVVEQHVKPINEGVLALDFHCLEGSLPARET